MKRRRVILGVLTAVGLPAAAVAVTLWATEPAPGVTEENARRLRRGMSRARVEAILGGPGEPVHGQIMPSGRYEWRGDRFILHCAFTCDDNDALWRATILDDHDESRDVHLELSSLVDRVRDFLGL